MAYPASYTKFKHTLPDGTPAVGYKLYSYLSGTTTPEVTYTDQTEGAANANPTILDGNGEASVWLKPTTAYKLVLKTDADVTVWTVDAINIRGAWYVSTLNASGQITSTVATGTAPFVISSTTEVANLNAAKLKGKDWANPDPLGSATPSTAVFTALTVSGASVLDTAQLGSAIFSDYATVGLSTQGQKKHGIASESIILNVGAAFTESAGNLLPADSIIEAVVAKVTQTITTAANWKLGDAGQTARFLPVTTDLASGTKKVGLAHRDPTVATADLGPVQSAAAKLRITLNANPGAGTIFVAVLYSQFVAAT